MFRFVLVEEKATSKAIIKRSADIGSLCVVPLSNLKYGAVLPPLITHDFGFFIKVAGVVDLKFVFTD